MRARNIKPGFFTNDRLAECDPLARILFAGLWTIADREGRLEDRPKKIKAEILPYDSQDPETLLEQLEHKGFIERYRVNDIGYIQILNFAKHQNPHVKEAPSNIPAPDKHCSSTGQESEIPATTRPLTDSPSLIPDPNTTPLPRADEFLDRARIHYDISDEWLNDCKAEMGWSENVIRDVWIKFNGHWRNKIGHAALKTQEQWGAEWRTWYRGTNIKSNGKSDGKQAESKFATGLAGIASAKAKLAGNG